MKTLILFLSFLFFLAFGFFVIQLTAENPFMDGDELFSLTVFGQRIELDFTPK